MEIAFVTKTSIESSEKNRQYFEFIWRIPTENWKSKIQKENVEWMNDADAFHSNDFSACTGRIAYTFSMEIQLKIKPENSEEIHL